MEEAGPAVLPCWGRGHPWSGESHERPGLLAQMPRLRNAAGLGQAGTGIYTPAAVASPLAGILERGMWVHWGRGLAARSKHISPRSQIAHGRPRPLGLPTASGASRAGQSSSGFPSGPCLGPLIPLSKCINGADYHSNGCYPQNSNIIILIIAI